MDETSNKIARRKFVKLAGATTIIAPLAGLTACGGKEESVAAPSKPAPKPAPPAAKPAPKPAPTQQAAAPPAPDVSSMPKLEESDPLAQSLGYKHKAADVDAEKFPKRSTPAAANEYCKNCALYSGGDGEWGLCSIFPGKVVAADGWCATYAAVS